jgi:phage head maturation protease
MPTESTAFAWAPITKSEKQEDGTVIVYGPAATSALDRDHQRLDQGWLDQAMPEWMAEGGNVREQHDARRAVGVGVGLSKGDDGAHYIAAHIVDPVAVKKVETGVLKGFSVGIKAPTIQMGKADAPKGLVTGGSIVEVSVVDRPANPGCLFELAKADAAGDLAAVEDAQVVETDEAPDAVKADLPAAPRTISTKADLRKAITAAEADADRLHISKRAEALGLEGMVPSNWNGDGSLSKADDTAETTPEETDAVDPVVEKAEAVLREVRGLVPELAKADAPAGGGEGADISGAQQAIACIAGLIIAEAESLAQGNLNEAGDISVLLEAVSSLRWFINREEAESRGDNTMLFADTADLAKADEPEAVKADEPQPESPAATEPEAVKADEPETAKTTEPETAKADEPEAVKADEPQPESPAATVPAATQTPDYITKADVAELIKSAVAEATTATKERTETLEAELAKAQKAISEFSAMPQPGGPVMTRTAAQEQTARQGDAEALRAQARAYLSKSEQVTDRDLRDGYREKAAELIAKAEA